MNTREIPIPKDVLSEVTLALGLRGIFKGDQEFDDFMDWFLHRYAVHPGYCRTSFLRAHPASISDWVELFVKGLYQKWVTALPGRPGGALVDTFSRT